MITARELSKYQELNILLMKKTSVIQVYIVTLPTPIDKNKRPIYHI